MRRRHWMIITAAFATSALGGCESMPGSRGQQGAVIGGATGAAAGAAISQENRLLGALIGGALGAGGGYLIGAETDWFGGDPEESRLAARRADQRASHYPATVSEALEARTADLNRDGFVTQDEVIAMERAGLDDQLILSRLRATGQIFELTAQQENDLIEEGVSLHVVKEMQLINYDERRRLLSQNDILGQDPR